MTIFSYIHVVNDQFLLLFQLITHVLYLATDTFLLYLANDTFYVANDTFHVANDTYIATSG